MFAKVGLMVKCVEYYSLFPDMMQGVMICKVKPGGDLSFKHICPIEGIFVDGLPQELSDFRLDSNKVSKSSVSLSLPNLSFGVRLI